MPTFEYAGPTPNLADRLSTVDAAGNPVALPAVSVSEPVDYLPPGVDAEPVLGRVFELGEHVEAASNPDPARFNDVTQPKDEL